MGFVGAEVELRGNPNSKNSENKDEDPDGSFHKVETIGSGEVFARNIAGDK